jgi:hypothetical protein
MEFKLPELALFASSVKYNPALSLAINALYNTKSQPEYDIALQEATKIAIGYDNVQIYTRKDYGQSSNLSGMPLFQPLNLIGEDGQEDLLLESAVLEGSRTKNIVSTTIQGRDTSVDEFINNGDYQVSVQGILCANEPRYPLDLVLKFQKFMDLNRSIKIEHELLNALGVYELIITSHKYAPTTSINLQTYSFTAKSTVPLPLIIQDQNTQIV